MKEGGNGIAGGVGTMMCVCVKALFQRRNAVVVYEGDKAVVVIACMCGRSTKCRPCQWYTRLPHATQVPPPQHVIQCSKKER